MVTRGLGAAHALGYPTINVTYASDCPLAAGIYAAFAERQGQRWRGVAVVGGDFAVSTRPKVEIHLFERCDVSENEPVMIQFCQQIGVQEKISSRDELIKKIARDVATAKKWWAEQ